MPKKMKDEEKKIPKSIAFSRDLLLRIDRAKGMMSRSLFTNIAVDEKLKIEEQKLGILQ